ncbi:guanine deaminase, putative [Phytophthora infestans T30-4]|uniref:Guanine deaminase n=2 Tax=Phytophthora infestans TaxID=4787 RepID=D0N3X9_PHYIT|nr:guanine deaminase, putative [Phytophthora infestans T30-4]EEY69083.1 guanine deaminase, putative [Phytophthora infestans T30-4]KAF4037457.1 Amidohydrolase family [Phytophthora infestans]KAF4142474.1 Amidohydrolase family [Phytophthora infestans]|eukprot:XP_002998937.1 guanine deaminase, putative [Phytophthora infestans T30-4]
MTHIIAYKANVVHSVALGELQVLQPGLVGVNEHGKIVFVLDLSQSPLVTRHFDELVDLGEQLLLPGFIDGHAHAPQYSFIGVGMHLPLLQWLETYTFPYESKFQNLDYARAVYEKAVQRHLSSGTTTCSYFATVHLEACKVLADVLEQAGQRGYVGKVNMDRNGSSGLQEETQTSIDDTREFVLYVQSKRNELVTPVITPRFVPSCTSKLMKALAEISREHQPKLPVQSHLGENRDEISWVKSLHPESETYTGVYDDHGLLHDRSYMAHCIWCSKSERELLREKKTAVIHCPNSNFSLSSGVLNVRRLLQEGIKVGLGTDVSGGYSPSMLDAIRQAVIASKLVSIGNGSSGDEDTGESQHEPLSFAEAFHLATVGSAEALGLGDRVGNFMVDKDFDALVVDPYAPNSPIDEAHDPVEAADVLHTFQKFLFLGDDRNIVSIFVGGRQVKNAAPKLKSTDVTSSPLTPGSVHPSIQPLSLATG